MGAVPASGGPARDVNISQLIAATLGQRMSEDERIVLLGEDIAHGGGTFGATRNLLRRFGPERVRDTPISEMSFLGAGIGLAMSGWRPVVEVMFADFFAVCLEQLVNAAAKNRYMSGGRVHVPMTVRTAAGCVGVAAQHSQTLWGALAHFPGLKVVAPSNPYDYRGLLTAAIDSDDPVVFVEHKDVYLRKVSSFPLGTTVPEQRFTVPIGRAAVVREGTDLTIATLSTMVERSLDAAERLRTHGVDVEVIDLRTVAPLDHETVAASVAKTRRLLVVDEDYRSFGLSGELVARIVEHLGPAALDATGRLAVPDVPIPAALALEDQVVPRTGKIVDAVLTMTGVRGPRQD